MPRWALREEVARETAALHFVILRECLPAQLIPGMLTPPPSTPHEPYFMLVADQIAARQLGDLTPFQFAVTAAAEDLDIVCEALAVALIGQNMIGVDTEDFASLGRIDGRLLRPGFAKVLRQPPTTDCVQAAMAELASLAAKGFDGNIAIITMYGDREVDLYEVDAFATPVFGSRHFENGVLSAPLNCSTDAAVLMSFAK